MKPKTSIILEACVGKTPGGADAGEDFVGVNVYHSVLAQADVCIDERFTGLFTDTVIPYKQA